MINILGLCDRPEVLEIMVLVKFIISAICIAVPIILIYVLTIDYAKAVASSDQDMVFKVTKKIPIRAAAVVLIFFMPLLVKTVLYIADSDADGYYGCIENSTPEKISEAYVNTASKLVDKVRET